MSFFRARFLRAFEKIARLCMGFSTRFLREFRAKYRWALLGCLQQIEYVFNLLSDNLFVGK